MPVGNLRERGETEPFPEFHHLFLMAESTERTALAGEGQKIFMAALSTSDPGKAVAQNATVQIAVRSRTKDRDGKTHRPALHALIIARILGSARPVEVIF